jgi:hypothetical protein
MTAALPRLARASLALAAIVIVSSTEAPAFAQRAKPAPPPAPAPAPAAPPAAPAPSADEAAKADARAHFERGFELLSEEAYDPAFAEFAASRKIFATKAATKNAAICLRRLQRYDEALDMFEAFLRDFPNLTEHDQTFASKEMTSLRGLVGSVAVRGGEPGAVVAVDGRERGATPAPAPLRVPTGSHAVRVFKSGFTPFESRVDVAGGQNVVVNVRLEALARSGRLSAAEQAGRPAQVLVDNVVVGKSPWEGTVSVGEHTVVLRGEGDLATQPATARVNLNDTTKLTLAVEPLTSTLRVEPTPVNALVSIDGVSVGRGIWEGRLRAGAHKLEIADEGFFPATQSVSLTTAGRSLEKVALERDTSSSLWRVSIPARFLVEATVGGVLSPSFGGDVTDCGSCSAGLVFGGRARASLGYELGLGLGFALDAGYAWARQSVTDRPTTLSPLPVGSSPPENGTSDHELTARGATLGGAVFFHRGTKVRWTLRAGGGIWLASVNDRRSGSFTTSVSARPDGTTGAPTPYSTDTLEQSQGAQYAYAAPEARIGLPLGKSAELSFGVEAFLAFALKQPTWNSVSSRVVTGTCRTDASGGCVTDGLAVFDDSKLTSSTIFLLVPGIALRYEL